MNWAVLRLAFFIVGVLGTAFAVGFFNMPGAWYAGLVKPPFNPPNGSFAPVWSLIYVLIAIAGWRSWERQRRGIPFAIWSLQMALNLVWPAVFFSAHLTTVALAVIVALLGSILAFVAKQWREDRISSILFIPYAAWVALATVLNFEIVRLN